MTSRSLARLEKNLISGLFPEYGNFKKKIGFGLYHQKTRNKILEGALVKFFTFGFI